MLYVLEQDPKEELTVIELCASRDMELPQFIQNMPRVQLGNELYWTAFWNLIGHRGGMGDGPIVWCAVEEYARYNGFDDEQREALHHHVRAMSSALLKHNSGNGDGSEAVQREDQGHSGAG